MITTAWWLAVTTAEAPAQDPGGPPAGEASLPDVDLAVRVPLRREAEGGAVLRFPAEVTLTSRPTDEGASESIRAWSLSLVAREATVDRPTTRSTDVPPFVFLEGYEKTEVASGPAGEGVVSAVILSLISDARLPLSQTLVVLRFDVVADVPENGCGEVVVEFVDGLAGSGRPVRNVVTCGEGITRRDDGGESDHDEDGYEVGRTQICRAREFVRGNVNGDGPTNVSDGLALLAILFGGRGSAPCEEAADINGDGTINLTDVVYLLEFLFQGGPSPPPPHPSCGRPAGPLEFSCDGDTGC